jgi:hypothetical protein
MRKRIIGVATMLASLVLSVSVQAQDFSSQTLRDNYLKLQQRNQLDQFDEQIESIVKLFSSMVGSGFVHTASLHKVGGIDVGLRGVFVTVPEEFQDIVKPPQDLPDPLEDTGFVPFPFLHASLGLPANFEVTARFFSISIADEPGGNVTLLGGAVKYGLLKDNLALPAITLLAGYQTLMVPDEYAFGTVSTVSAKGFISKSFAIATIYGGGGLDRTMLTIEIPGIIDKEYNVNYYSGTIGVTIDPLPLFKVNADFNFGELRTFSAGVGLSFR